MTDEISERYRQLAEAMLQRIYPLDQVEVRLGEVPEKWPAAATLPRDTTVVGGVARRRDGQLTAMTLYLEGVLSAEMTLAHYESALQAAGWTRFEPKAPGQGAMGFRSAVPSSASTRVFCRQESDPFFNVQVSERTGRRATLVTWDAGLEHHPLRLRQPTGPYGPGGPLGHLIPDLAAPEGVPVQAGGGGGSENEWEIRARAHTEMIAAELAGHYREQIQRAGWTLRDAGGDPVVQWSRWKLAQDDYEGMFVVAEALPDLRDLTLTIRSPSRSARGWRMWSSATTRYLG